MIAERLRHLVHGRGPLVRLLRQHSRQQGPEPRRNVRHRRRQRGRGDEPVRDDQLLPVNVLARAIRGDARVDAADLAALSPGDVIVLDSLAADPLRVMVGNCERFAGFPGTKGRKMALQVSGLVDDDGWVKTFEDAVHE